LFLIGKHVGLSHTNKHKPGHTADKRLKSKSMIETPTPNVTIQTILEKRGTNLREIILKMRNAEKQINLIKRSDQRKGGKSN
jgi:hypothetical protein